MQNLSTDCISAVQLIFLAEKLRQNCYYRLRHSYIKIRDSKLELSTDSSIPFTGSLQNLFTRKTEQRVFRVSYWKLSRVHV